jgi:hypothetical protein
VPATATDRASNNELISSTHVPPPTKASATITAASQCSRVRAGLDGPGSGGCARSTLGRAVTGAAARCDATVA